MQRYKNFLNRARIFIKKMYATFSRKVAKLQIACNFFSRRENFVLIKLNLIL